MIISNVAWARDHQGHAVLDLRMDGHPAHIHSSQKADLLGRGIVEGVVYLTSERPTPGPTIFMRGDAGPRLSDAELVDCTDDPRVFALHAEMCEAIRAGTWQVGSRGDPPEDRPVDRTDQPPVGPRSGDPGRPTRRKETRPC